MAGRKQKAEDGTRIIGTRTICTMMDLPLWRVTLALETGLLPQVEKNRVLETTVASALEDKDGFLARLDEVTPINLTEAADRLKVSTVRVKKAILATGVPVVKTESWRHGEVKYWRTSDITGRVAEWLRNDVKGNAAAERGRKAAVTRQSNANERWVERRNLTLAEQAAKAEREAVQAAELKERLTEKSYGQDLRIRVLTDMPHPKTLTVHAGPTNSGKTFMALAALAEAGHGVYAGPLRMLAREAYVKLSAMLGEENVGMITGEEQINPDAPVICATAEAAPLYTVGGREGGVLVVDECHWMSDPQRGWAWTRLLVAGQFDHIHAITDQAAADIVISLVPDAEHVTRIDHPRLSKLTYGGTKHLKDMPVGSAVVAFSRVAVHAIADMLTAAGRKPAILYGALPPVARLDQIERLISGDADIIVTTDVIGHGINLPLTAVALAETQKFDGVVRRQLYKWEAAQILGRAGRFGHGTEHGITYSVTGEPWFTSDAGLIMNATEAAAGRTSTGWSMRGKPAIRPTLGELHVTQWTELAEAVQAFAITTERAAEILPIQPFNAAPVLERLAVIKPILSGDRQNTVDVATIWNLIMCPIDDLSLIATTVGVLLTHGKARAKLSEYAEMAQTRYGAPLAQAEAAARCARNLRAVTLAVGDLPHVTLQEATEWEQHAGEIIVKTLRKTGGSGYGKCSSCGKACPPWFTECDSCHNSNRWGGGHNNWDDDYDTEWTPPPAPKKKKKNNGGKQARLKRQEARKQAQTVTKTAPTNANIA